MKTSSKIFAAFFSVLSLVAAGAALGGATHQWFTAALCAAVALALVADILNKDEADNTPRFFS